MQWVKINNETVNRILDKSDNSLHGYFLEVDLDYPKYLYDSHKHYLMALEKIKIKVEWLSPYCSEIKNKHDIKTRNINKLAPNLMPKRIMLFIIDLEIFFIKRIDIKKSTQNFRI